MSRTSRKHGTSEGQLAFYVHCFARSPITPTSEVEELAVVLRAPKGIWNIVLRRHAANDARDFTVKTAHFIFKFEMD